jgi:hypothetical protein
VSVSSPYQPAGHWPGQPPPAHGTPAQPPPTQSTPAQPPPTQGTPAQNRTKRRLHPAVRAVLLLVALIVVLPLAVGLPLRDQLKLYDKVRGVEQVTVVGHGKVGETFKLRWQLARVSVSSTPMGLTFPPGGTLVRFDLDVRALPGGFVDDSPEVRFEVQDHRGRRWSATQAAGTKLNRPGGPLVRLAVLADVPKDVVDEVELLIGPQERRSREHLLLLRR